MEKYERIHEEGLKALKSGDITVFPGFSEKLRQQFCVCMLFKKIIEKIQQAIKETERKGIRFLLAGRDYPLHSTVLEGKYFKKDREEKFSSLDTMITSVNLVGLQVKYNWLLANKDNILLAAWPIPEPIIEARKSLTELYKKHGLTPLPINILHITVARIVRFTEPKQPLKDYRNKLISLKREIEAEPIILTVTNVVKQSTYEFLTSFS